MDTKTVFKKYGIWLVIGLILIVAVNQNSSREASKSSITLWTEQGQVMSSSRPQKIMPNSIYELPVRIRMLSVVPRNSSELAPPITVCFKYPKSSIDSIQFSGKYTPVAVPKKLISTKAIPIMCYKIDKSQMKSISGGQLELTDDIKVDTAKKITTGSPSVYVYILGSNNRQIMTRIYLKR